MDRITLFLETMTIWNWLALIAFIFFPLSALNAFLNLKTRYRDWRGIQNKKQFDKRIKELKTQFFMTETYKQDSTAFFTVVLWYASELLAPLIIVIALFSLGAQVWQSYLAATIVSSIFMKHAIALNQLISRVQFPELFAIAIIEFIKSGADKGLNSESADRLIHDVGRSNVYSTTQREIVFHYLGQRYPEKLSSFIHPAP